MQKIYFKLKIKIKELELNSKYNIMSSIILVEYILYNLWVFRRIKKIDIKKIDTCFGKVIIMAYKKP